MIDKANVLTEAARLRALFEAAGAVPVETDILQPADTLLDLYGEDIRARAFTTTDPLRGELMLRPDFTVPVVQAHMANGADPARYTYAGEVFRRQESDPARPLEYLQVGLEVFDGADPARADAEAFTAIAGALDGLPVAPATGDVGIVTAVLDGMALSDDRRAALMRHLWRPRRFRQLIDRFAGRRPPPPTRAALLARVRAGEEVLTPDIPRVGLRSDAEVRARIDRLLRDAEEPPLPSGEVDLLDQVTSLADTCPAALERLRDIAVDLPSLRPALDRFEARLAALSGRGVDVDALPFEASYGRTTMEYYDGFVFGFAAPGRADLPPVATGGRYDALTRRLGRGRAIPAVGGVIRPEVALKLSEAAP